MIFVNSTPRKYDNHTNLMVKLFFTIGGSCNNRWVLHDKRLISYKNSLFLVLRDV